MILAAAACAAAGISYIFNDDEQSTNSKYIQNEKDHQSIVTVSSTIIDKQGILKYVIHPRTINPYSLFNQKQKGAVYCINEWRLNQIKLPIENNKQNKHCIFKPELSLVFSWSIPLKARLLQIPTKQCFIVENLNPFQRNSMKISIGIQNESTKSETHENVGISHLQYYMPSKIALSNCDEYSYDKHLGEKSYDDTLDSLSYNPMINDNITPIGILKKKKLDLNENENNQKKRFCHEDILNSNEQNVSWNDEKTMRNTILKNVNLCVENLSKILSETYSDNEEDLTILPNSSSIISPMNNNNNSNKKLIPSIREDIDENIHSKLFQPEDHHILLNPDSNDSDFTEILSDGKILHRGKQFGIALGEPMIRKYGDLYTNSYHSINELNRLLTKTNYLLMHQYKIESIEDLIRLFLDQGQHHFTELMINSFKVDPLIVEQFNIILAKWAENLT